jgi:HK97 family phage major capsid protein
MWIELLKDYLGCKAGQRLDVEEKDAQHLISQSAARALANNPLAEAIEQQLGASMASVMKGLDEAVTSALNRFRDAQAQSRRLARPILFGDKDGDPDKNFGDWLVNVAHATVGKGQRRLDAANRLEKVYGSDFSPWQKAAMGEASGATGGYIVPPDFYQQLLAVAAEDATFRQNAFVQPMASATLQFPYLDITTAQSAGNSPFFGGVIASWTSEAQTRQG